MPRRVSRPSASRGYPRLGRGLVLGAALSLLSMPVSYRGGAEAAHAHVFFQAWIDAAHGSFDHHRAEAGDAAPHHGAAHRMAAPPAAREFPDPEGPTSSAPTVP